MPKRRSPRASLPRKYNVPFRSSNVTASNAVDVQAAYESGMSLWSTIMGGVNLIEHAAGWLEGGLTASFEKLILDAEMLQMMRSFLDPVVVDEPSLAVDAIHDVGPGGHFFGTRTYTRPFRKCILRADAIGLAQFRELVGERCQQRH